MFKGMARVSNINKSDAIPQEDKDKLSTCLFCGEKVSIGGCWSGEYEVGVCGNHSGSLVDLLIDTLEDTESFEHLSANEKLQYLNNICENRLLKKEAKKRAMKK